MCENNKTFGFTKKDSGMEVYTVQVDSKSCQPPWCQAQNCVQMRLKRWSSFHSIVPILE